MIRCIVVDDEPPALNLMVNHVEKTPGLQLILATKKPEEAVARASEGDVDLMFLDVEMPNLNGFDVIKLLPHKTKVIFCTGFTRYAVDGYGANVLDYLLKPITYPRFMQAVQKAIEAIGTEKKAAAAPPKGHFFIQSESRTGRVKINFEDIDLIEGSNNYTAIYCGTDKWLTLTTMKDLLEGLPTGQFVRVHNSYIVPVRHIEFIDAIMLRLANIPRAIPIGPTYKKKVFEALQLSEK
jgi:two-component system, LytTR family, response regulator